MQLAALVESSEHVCCRYRLAAFRPFLQEAGHFLELRPLPRGWWSRLRLLGCELCHADAVILQRKLLPSWQLGLLRRSTRILLFDFDDAVFLRDSYHPRGLDSPRRQRRFAATVRAADVVVAGNSFLSDQAAQWISCQPELGTVKRDLQPVFRKSTIENRQSKIQVIPTCVEATRYPPAAHVRAGADVELVWVGSSSTLQGLEAIRSLLEGLGQRFPGLRLKLVCDRFLHFRHLPVISCPWSEAGEPAALAAADIGISWLPDDLWSRGKCGLKVLQYMAAGLPVVANPVGVQADMVRHGETGFLAETAAEWAEAIHRLALDPALRRRMGAAGRDRVRTDFSVAVGAARWIDLLNRLQPGVALAG